MENASKALIIAGGILIAILLLTLFSYLFGQMASSTSSIYQSIEKHEKDEFNQQFLNYEGRGIVTRKNAEGEEVINYLTPQDVATLINLAQNSENNSKFRNKVEIYLDGTVMEESTKKNWLQNNGNKDAKYKCRTVNINSDTLLVDKVYIETQH